MAITLDGTDGITVSGNVTTSGLFIGDGSNLTGVDATKIINGTSDVTVDSSGGPVSVDIGGTNILNFTSTGITNGQADGVGNIGASGGGFNTVHAKATSAQYADLAEKYTADADYAPGTVLVFGGTAEVTASVDENDHRVAGVVSTNPSYLMNSKLQSEHVAVVALVGRVPTLCIGPITKGDILVSASNGHAKVNNDATAGRIVGKALEDLNAEAGIIEIVVGAK